MATKIERAAKKTEERRLMNAAWETAEKLSDEFDYCGVFHDGGGALEIKLTQLTEAEARAVLTFARDSGLIAKLNDRQNKE